MWTQLAQFVRLQFVYMITIKLFLRLSWSWALVPPLHFFKYLLDLLACQMHTKLLRPCSIFVYIFSILSFTIFQPPYIFLVSFFFAIPLHISPLLNLLLAVVVSWWNINCKPHSGMRNYSAERC